MNESSQAIVAVKREVQLSEWQRQVQERQEQGIPVDEWCASLGISKGAYYHRLRKVREYMCQQMGVMEGSDPRETAQSIKTLRMKYGYLQAVTEMFAGNLQTFPFFCGIRFL